MNSFFARRYVITGIFIAIAIILLARLFYMQIIDDRYFLYAKNNVVHTVIRYPARGPILDRNGKILVENQPVYDVMVTPKLVKPFDTIEFCKLIGIDMPTFRKHFKKAVIHSPRLQSVFEGQLSPIVYASLQERMSEFPGFEVISRSVRSYPDSIAAQFLGYIGEVSEARLKRMGNSYYHQGDYIGITGVESAYETELRGQRGVEQQLVDNKGNRKGVFANGAFDTAAVAGERLTSSLDSRIQKLGEKLMTNKVGSIVAIEPSTGEILCFVSSPTYNPNQMVGHDRSDNYNALNKDPYQPFFVRPIQARYSPGSSFKPLSALVALQEGVITPHTSYLCTGRYWPNGGTPKCTHVHGLVNLSSAIAESCNGYFAMVFEKLINVRGAKLTDTSFSDWRSKVSKFGLGARLDVDLPAEQRGNLPTAKFYNRIYGVNHWRSRTVLSLSIGQGEVESTPLQLANIECTIANRGFYYKPHLIKAIGDKNMIKPEFTVKNDVGISPQYFEPVINGMQQVVEYGTARASRIPGIVMVGKTGTVQNSRGKNHSVFVAFAPRDNPKIAIAVVVENSGDGGTFAAPIASFIVEKYLKDSITFRGPGFTVDYFTNKNLLPDLPGSKPKVILPKDSIKRGLTDSGNKLKAPKVPVKSNKVVNIAAPKRKEHNAE